MCVCMRVCVCEACLCMRVCACVRAKVCASFPHECLPAQGMGTIEQIKHYMPEQGTKVGSNACTRHYSCTRFVCIEKKMCVHVCVYALLFV